LGDFLFTLAITMVSSLDDPFAYRTVSEAGRTMCEGELRQVGTRGNYDLSEGDYLEIIGDKTAALYACCCRLGAYYSGADEDLRERLARYGYQLGVAFQIIDDLLDLLGDEAKAGKSLGTDLIKQKPTLPVIRLLDQADAHARKEILAALSSPGGVDRETLRPWLKRTGAVDYARQRAVWYIRSATEELEDLTAGEAHDALLGIADFVITRQQ
jgi:octaprenyl-diphosphate synthase